MRPLVADVSNCYASPIWLDARYDLAQIPLVRNVKWLDYVLLYNTSSLQLHDLHIYRNNGR